MRGRNIVLPAALALLVSLVGVPAHAAPTEGVDLAVTVAGPARTPLRGESFSTTITLRNTGSEAATNVVVGSYVSDALQRDAYSASDPGVVCTQNEHRELRCELATLGAGASATVELSFTRLMARETWVDAWISSPEIETDLENNYDGIRIAPDRSNPADVSVTTRFPEQPDPDTTFDYVSKVINYGPQRAHDVRFVQSLAEGVRFVSVSSSDPADECSLHEEVYDEAGVEGGPYYHREVRCSLGDMAFATQSVITVTVVRTDPHELWSSVWVSTSSFDDNYDNDWAEASHPGHPSVTSDLTMTLQRSKSFALVGEEFDYTLTVTNLGPVAAPNVRVETWLPQELALRSITPAEGGEPCTQDDYQGISCKVASLAAGQSASFTLAVTRVRAREYWMGGSVWSDNYDPDYENSYVEDHMAADKSIPADVGVKMQSPENPPVGSQFDYDIAVTNHGPNPAGNVSLTAGIPDGTDYVSWTSSDTTDSCTIFEETYDDEMEMEGGDASGWVYRELRCDLGTLAAGQTTTVTLTVTRNTDYELWNSAWVASSTYDANYDNDYASAASAGKPRPGCGESVDSAEGGMIVCHEVAGDMGRSSESGGGGTLSGAGRRRVLRAGDGDDSVFVRLSGRPKKHRKIVLKGGKGRDTINVSVAPGTGNITLILRGGGGRDTLSVEAPVPGKRFKVRMYGGAGRDSCESLRGDRFRKRAC
ncbi:MAG TPA: DUF11 domain-containing protein [Actinomycetota bacterium]|nr:DUF11 domain-containing protein [Actinomycetota bacterium]